MKTKLIAIIVVLLFAGNFPVSAHPDKKNQPHHPHQPSQDADDQEDIEEFQVLREKISHLSFRSLNAPTKASRKNLLKVMGNRIKNAEKLTKKGNYQSAVNVLEGILTKLDGQEKDWVKDDPRTPDVDERVALSQLVEQIIQELEQLIEEGENEEENPPQP